jgi:uncharacterized protein YjbI with pentapeptide repeats
MWTHGPGEGAGGGGAGQEGRVSTEELQRRCDALEAENDRLRRALREHEGAQDARRRAAGGVGALGWRLVAGKALDEAIRAWVKGWFEDGQVRAPETADLLIALARRLIRVGAVGVLMAALPAALLLHQNWLMSAQNDLVREQNAFFRDQNQKISQQLALQIEESWLSRRRELLAALYTPLAECVGQDCPPAEGARARQEALRVIAALGRRHGDAELDLSGALLQGVRAPEIDLSGARLDGAVVVGADLDGANLTGAAMGGLDGLKLSLVGARLDRAVLTQARLKQARLLRASLREAQLDGADLTGAALTGADLAGASLRKTRLDGADLREANLAGADLSTASLEGARLERARADAHTRWPPGFDPGKAGVLPP